MRWVCSQQKTLFCHKQERSGLQGIQGFPGPKGDNGLIGPQGPRGLQGEPGAKGDKGDSMSVEDLVSAGVAFQADLNNYEARLAKRANKGRRATRAIPEILVRPATKAIPAKKEIRVI